MNDNAAPLTTDACPIRVDAAGRLTTILNAEYFRALCEPVRLSLIVQLVRQGRSDVTALAQTLPQDRSVISRHLQILERAGIVSSQQEGRHVFYQLEAQATVAQFEAMLGELRELLAMDDGQPCG